LIIRNNGVRSLPKDFAMCSGDSPGERCYLNTCGCLIWPQSTSPRPHQEIPAPQWI